VLFCGAQAEFMKKPDIDALARECEITFHRASGPGGQHRNKVETAVRVRHLPTGLLARASERRSREQNRREALRRLAARIAERNRKRPPRIPTAKAGAVRERELAEKKRVSAKKTIRRRDAEE
jgi:ribosome-associated protein